MPAALWGLLGHVCEDGGHLGPQGQTMLGEVRPLRTHSALKFKLGNQEIEGYRLVVLVC